MKLLLRFFGWIFAVGTVLFLVGVAGAAGLFWHFSKDLPDYSQLQDYEPPVMTRVHASDGALVAEYARERRLYLPIQAVPKLVLNATEFREANITPCDSLDAFNAHWAKDDGGWLITPWAALPEQEEVISKEHRIAIRCLPLDKQNEPEAPCLLTGTPTRSRAIWGRSY